MTAKDSPPQNISLTFPLKLDNIDSTERVFWGHQYGTPTKRAHCSKHKKTCRKTVGEGETYHTLGVNSTLVQVQRPEKDIKYMEHTSQTRGQTFQMVLTARGGMLHLRIQKAKDYIYVTITELISCRSHSVTIELSTRTSEHFAFEELRLSNRYTQKIGKGEVHEQHTISQYMFMIPYQAY